MRRGFSTKEKILTGVVALTLLKTAFVANTRDVRAETIKADKKVVALSDDQKKAFDNIGKLTGTEKELNSVAIRSNPDREQPKSLLSLKLNSFANMVSNLEGPEVAEGRAFFEEKERMKKELYERYINKFGTRVEYKKAKFDAKEFKNDPQMFRGKITIEAAKENLYITSVDPKKMTKAGVSTDDFKEAIMGEAFALARLTCVNEQEVRNVEEAIKSYALQRGIINVFQYFIDASQKPIKK